MPEDLFYDSSLNPENDGFCSDGCLGNGVQNLSNCYDGVSMFLSQPHFLNADVKFIEFVDGVQPKKESHDTIVNFHPVRIIFGVKIINSNSNIANLII